MTGLRGIAARDANDRAEDSASPFPRGPLTEETAI